MLHLTLESREVIYFLKNINYESPFETDSTVTNDNYQLSFFSREYLKRIAESLRDIHGSGIFFEKGYVNIGDTDGVDLYKKDVLVTKQKMRELHEACSEYVNEQTPQVLRRMMRKIITTFFGIDYVEADEYFMENACLSQFWSKIVGNRELARKIAPDLFQSDVRLIDIYINLDGYQDQFFVNATDIIQSLKKYLDDPYWGSMRIVIDNKMGIYEQYFWVEVEDLNIFKGLDFDSN